MSLVDADLLPTPSAVQTAGLDGVLGYIRNLTAAEVAGFHAHGLAVGLIAEFDTLTHHPVLDGASGGNANGAKAAIQLGALGAPAGAGLTLWATADTNVVPTQFAAVAAYCDTFATHIPGFDLGIYGGADLCDYLVTRGHAVRSWVAGATSWSHGHTSTTACLFQRVTSSPLPATDLDTYLDGHSVETCGLWLANTTPTPIPAPSKGTTEMVTLMKTADSPSVYLTSNTTATHVLAGQVAAKVYVANVMGEYVNAPADAKTVVVEGHNVWVVADDFLNPLVTRGA